MSALEAAILSLNGNPDPQCQVTPDAVPQSPFNQDFNFTILPFPVFFSAGDPPVHQASIVRRPCNLREKTGGTWG